MINYKSYAQRVTELLFMVMRKHQPSADQLMHIVCVLHQYKEIVPLTETTAKELVEFVSSVLDKQHTRHIQRCKNILLYGANYQLCIEEPVEVIRQLRDIILTMYRTSLPKISDHNNMTQTV